MIGKMIHGLETIREHFLLKDCKQRCTRGYKRYKETSGLIEWERVSDFPLYLYIVAGCAD